MQPQKARDKALSVPTVRAAYFFQGQSGHTTGTVYDSSVGIEFDVRQTDSGAWNVNDDDGRDFKSSSLRRALKKAIGANS